MVRTNEEAGMGMGWFPLPGLQAGGLVDCQCAMQCVLVPGGAKPSERLLVSSPRHIAERGDDPRQPRVQRSHARNSGPFGMFPF